MRYGFACLVLLTSLSRIKAQNYRLALSASIGTSYTDLMSAKSPFANYDYKTKFINSDFYLINLDYRVTQKISVSLGYGDGTSGSSVDFIGEYYYYAGPLFYDTTYVLRWSGKSGHKLKGTSKKSIFKKGVLEKFWNTRLFDVLGVKNVSDVRFFSHFVHPLFIRAH